MFAALNVDIGSRSAGSGLAALTAFVPPRPKADDMTLLGGGFKLITAAECGGRLGWRRIRRLAGELSGNMVLPEGLKHPKYIGAFHPSRFEGLLVSNTAVELLQRSRLQIYRRVVGLVDIRGEYEDVVLRLLPFCLSVKVFTHRLHRYDAFAAKVLELYGVPLTFGDSPEMFADCVIVLDPGAQAKRPMGIYTITAADSAANGVISYLRAGLPDGGDIGLDGHTLAAALYELSGSKAAGELCASTARLSGRKVDFDELLREFERTAKQITL